MNSFMNQTSYFHQETVNTDLGHVCFQIAGKSNETGPFVKKMELQMDSTFLAGKCPRDEYEKEVKNEPFPKTSSC